VSYVFATNSQNSNTNMFSDSEELPLSTDTFILTFKKIDFVVEKSRDFLKDFLKNLNYLCLFTIKKNHF